MARIAQRQSALRITALSLAALGIATGVSGCTRPAPGVSVFSGTSSTFAEAACWGADGTAIDTTACAQSMADAAASGAQAPAIAVAPGATIGISVDPVVAEAGWIPVFGGSPLTEGAITSTYFRFTYPQLKTVPESGIALLVVAGTNDAQRGIWAFNLVPAS